VIGAFQTTIEKIVALAVLMPIVASMGGNAGTQTITIAVRALAMRKLTAINAGRFVVRETIVGSVNGVAFAVIAGLISWLWFGDLQIAGIMAAAMIVNLIVAGLFGTLIPLTLDRFGIDPAVASSVFITTVTDVIGFLSFLGLAAFILL
jgi:magnesium transporter